MRDVDVLGWLGERLGPRAYIQLGLERPELLTPARCATVGVGPSPRIAEGGHAGKPWLKLYAAEPEAFLAAENPEDVLEGMPLDLVVIAGRPAAGAAREIGLLARWVHAGTCVVVLPDEDGGERIAELVREALPAARVERAATEGMPPLIVTGFGEGGATGMPAALLAEAGGAGLPPLLPVEAPLEAKAASFPQRARRGSRDAVIFAWYVPEAMPELGEYYLRLLRFYHPDSRLFIGMNRGSDALWERRIRLSGLDTEVRWARPEVGDYWDATGFLTALEAFHESGERFELVWFGHTKGGGQGRFEDYARVRIGLEEDFWSRGACIDRLFDDPRIGIFAPHFCPLPPPFWARELEALQRVYRDRCAPLGLHARGTFFVMREAIARRFCEAVDEAFFRTPPGAYDAGRFFFEIGFPSIASMQGYEPFIDPDVAGANDPREDIWIAADRKQNHRIARGELARWRRDPIGFEARQLSWIEG